MFVVKTLGNDEMDTIASSISRKCRKEKDIDVRDQIASRLLTMTMLMLTNVIDTNVVDTNIALRFVEIDAAIKTEVDLHLFWCLRKESIP